MLSLIAIAVVILAAYFADEVGAPTRVVVLIGFVLGAAQAALQAKMEEGQAGDGR